MEFLYSLIIAIVISIIAYVIAPKPKSPSMAAPEMMDSPMASAGSPVVVVFGEVTVKSLNVLWYGDKRMSTHQV